MRVNSKENSQGNRKGKEEECEKYFLKQSGWITAKKPIKNGAKFTPIYECPVCGCKDVSWQSFCDECGQRLDWSDDPVMKR